MKQFSILILTLVLSACVGLPVSPPSAELDQAWAGRQQQLSAAHLRWKLSGRIAAHNDTEAWNASILWRQGEDDYDVNIIAPLNSDSLRLYGNSAGVTMKLPNGRIRTADTAEQLLSHQLGWQLPVEGMRYWVFGLPQPGGGDTRPQLDAHGRLAALKQAGWEITYDSYLRVGDLDLPRKIYLSRPRMELKIIIDRWELNG